MKKLFLTFIFLGSVLLSYAQETGLTNRQINEQIFFTPELEAYKYGRRTDGNGVGKSWFHRFGILHISDVHQRNENLLEAIEVATGKVYAVLNTGDDANGVHPGDGEIVRMPYHICRFRAITTSQV